MIDIQTVLTYLTLISVPVGIFYYMMTLRNTQKTQKLNATYRLLEVYRDQNEYYKWLQVLHLEWDDPDDFWEKYSGSTNPEMEAKFGTMFQYYDGLGYLWKEGVIDLRSLAAYFGWGCILMWKRYKPIVESNREHYLDFCIYWEQLAEALEELIGERIIH